MAEEAYENPLIPNARLREIYRSMVELRALGRVLPAKRRGGWTPRLEACVVSTSIDLGPGDLVSDTLTGGVIQFLRGATLAAVLHPEARTSRKVLAGCGAASPLDTSPVVAERLWAVLGAAAALKAAGKVAWKKSVEGAPNDKAGVVIALVRPGEVPDPLWRKVLASAGSLELPLVFVVMPPTRGDAAGKVSALSLRCGVPAIAVDADDAVAIYRVAQESIGRARTGGGAALIECVPFILKGATGKRAVPQDAIASMEQYLLQRKVAAPTWIAAQAKAFARHLAAE